MSRKDFHGGRSYSVEPPEGGALGLGLRLALAVGWAKLQLDRLLRRSSPLDGRASSREQEPVTSKPGGREARPFEAMHRPVPLSDLVSGVGGSFDGRVPRRVPQSGSQLETGNR